VKVHVKHLLRKLGLDSRVEAAVWAVRSGFSG
jgi:two-component system nitrate/nitrite response regulator NarL